MDSESQRSYVLMAREEYDRLKGLPGEAHPTPAASGVAPGIRASQEAYWRDLPELLKLKSATRQWVAYHRHEQVGFAGTDAELYQECARRGIPPGEFYVDRLEPRALPPWEEEDVFAQFETFEPGPPDPSPS